MLKKKLGGLLIGCLLSQPLWALAPEHEAHRLILAARNYIAADDYQKASDALVRIEALKISLPAEYHYWRGLVLQERGSFEQSRAHFESYVDATGSEGEFYEDALTRITQIEDAAVVVAIDPVAEKKKAELSWASNKYNDSYADQIKNWYGTDDLQKGLLRRINRLLKDNPYRELKSGRIDSELFYDLSADSDGSLITTRRKVQATSGRIAPEISATKLSVFGLNPYVEYECDRSSDDCVIYRPDSTQNWLRFKYDDSVAEELTKAISSLIKTMQKG